MTVTVLAHIKSLTPAQIDALHQFITQTPHGLIGLAVRAKLKHNSSPNPRNPRVGSDVWATIVGIRYYAEDMPYRRRFVLSVGDIEARPVFNELDRLDWEIVEMQLPDLSAHLSSTEDGSPDNHD